MLSIINLETTTALKCLSAHAAMSAWIKGSCIARQWIFHSFQPVHTCGAGNCIQSGY